MPGQRPPAPEPPAPEVAAACAEIAAEGYTILRGVADPAVIEALDNDFAQPFAETPFSQGAFFGSHTKRFGRALIRSKHSATLIQNHGRSA